MMHLCLLLSLAVQTPKPNAFNQEAWTHHILPSVEESQHERVDWIPEFGAGVLAANEQHKPLLFWGMNGHPLGCT